MALGTDMKSLVEDIQASREARAKALDDIRQDARRIIRGAKNMLKDFVKASEERAGEVKKLAHEVKSFRKSSGENRRHDFQATMKTVHASLVDVRKDSKHARSVGRTVVRDARDLLANIAKDNQEQARELREGLKKSNHHRKAEFKSMMDEIKDDLKGVKQDSDGARRDAKDMVSRYHHSRMSAQKHWASLYAERKKPKKQKSEE
jgi:ElaB/YqjD/DUF883 family membrane-anchored ribosome-binding protein